MSAYKKGIYETAAGESLELLCFAKGLSPTGDVVIYRPVNAPESYIACTQSQWEELLRPAEQHPVVPDDTLLSALSSVFGYGAFRPGQREIISAVLSKRDALAIFPTGGGKSLCYQLPAVLSEGITIVISPLISLMKDQVNALNQQGIPAAYLNSSLTDAQFEKAVGRIRGGFYRILYVAPERLLTARFLYAIEGMRVETVAVDEAHCISQWGQDFRPAYLDIPKFIERLTPRPCVCAFTATATEDVKRDIIRLLSLRDPFIRMTGFDRENLYFEVHKSSDKRNALKKLLRKFGNSSGIIYCAARKTVDQLYELLRKDGYAAARYHAGMEDEERRRNQEDFICDRCTLMVATNAFGMGIDKSDVRFVIHYNMPKDPESYYQEAGRAGRDGERAECHLLFSEQDVMIARFFIDKMGSEGELDEKTLRSTREKAATRLQAMSAYCRTSKCLRHELLSYFGEESPERCGNCGSCLNTHEKRDVSEEGKKVLSCVLSLPYSFGAQTVAELLSGSGNKEILRRNLNHNAFYGALRSFSRQEITDIIDALADRDLLRRRQINGGRFVLDIAPDAFERYADVCPLEIFRREKAKPESKRTGRAVPAAPEDPDLFEALRAVRKRLAEERHVPPYMICADTALRDMCARMPKSLDEMYEVKGMGEHKVRNFGRRFLEAINYAQRDS